MTTTRPTSTEEAQRLLPGIPLAAPWLGTDFERSTRTSLAASLQIAAPHHLGASRRSALDLTAPHSPPAWSPERAPRRNRHDRTAFGLPVRIYDRETASLDLVGAIERGVRSLTIDGVTVVRPVGSIAYARRGGSVLWSMVRDLDMWCYVSPSTFARSGFRDLTRDATNAIHDELEALGVRCSLRRGTLVLQSAAGRRLPMELKLARIDWLSDGILHLERRDLAIGSPRRPPYVVAPRPEWAPYTWWEHYFPSPEAEETFHETVSGLTHEDLLRISEFAYRDNLAVAYREARPRRLAAVAWDPVVFYRLSRKVLKVLLVLGTILDDERLQRAAIDQYLDLNANRDRWASRRSRAAYIATLMELLHELRAVTHADLARPIADLSEQP